MGEKHRIVENKLESAKAAREGMDKEYKQKLRNIHDREQEKFSAAE